MSRYLFSALSQGQRLTLINTSAVQDVLVFDDPTISATDVRVSFTATSTGLTYGGKTIWLDGILPSTLGHWQVEFANDSLLLLGDYLTDGRIDPYGLDYSMLATEPWTMHLWGLEGADLLVGAGAGDRLVGNVALSPLTHVSRLGSTGSPVGSSNASVSADGRYVAFDGDWTQFGTGGGEGVIVRDMVAGTASNEHRSASGAVGGSGAGAPQISDNGKFVAFLSASSNLVAGASSGALYDIYIASTRSAAIERVSVGTGGTLAADGRSVNPDLSFDGRYVVFESTTSNFASGGSTAQTDIFLRDRTTDTTTRLSTSLTGTDGNGESINARVSGLGWEVVFQSAASNLTAGDTNGYTDIFLWQRGVAGLVNITKDLPVVSNPNNGFANPDVSTQAQYDARDAVVTFETARNLVAEDTSNGTDVYAYHYKTGELQLVSSRADGSGVVLSSYDASISDDGRWVVFTSAASDLVADDTNGVADVFVKDLDTGAIALVSKTAAGVQGSLSSGNAQISAGGDWIVFESSAGNLASTDGNGTFPDVFRVANPLLRDTLQGGAGNDTYVINRNDVIVEAVGAGIDTVESSISYTLGANLENLTLTGSSHLSGTGNALKNVITGNSGNNRIDGAGGIDTASYANASAAVKGNLSLTASQATGFGSDMLVRIENLTGSRFGDELTGNAGANVLDGGSGNDTLAGGAGGDTYVVGSAGDVVVEAADGGRDTVLSAIDWTLGATLENLTLTGTTAASGTGNAAGNRLTGNGVANSLNGFAGSDTLAGAAGNDTLFGGAGNDRIDGGSGNDTLWGGSGSDTLTGGVGTDAFMVDSRTGTDLITDFESNIDQVRVSMSDVRIGDGDALVDGRWAVGFQDPINPAGELIGCTHPISALTPSAAAAAVGSATSAYAPGATVLFMFTTGTTSALFLFTSSGADAEISADELTLLVTVPGLTSFFASAFSVDFVL